MRTALSLPNVITLARMAALVPVVILLGLPEPETNVWALAVFAVAAASDAVDGPLARHRRAVTRLGAFLDPLADKLLISGTLIALLARDLVPAWVVVIVVARELVVTNVRVFALARGRFLWPSRWAKTKATLQFVAVGGLLLLLVAPVAEVILAVEALLTAAIALTLISGIEVLARAWTTLSAPASSSLEPSSVPSKASGPLDPSSVPATR